MNRKIIPKQELLDWLNTELHKDADCRDCKFNVEDAEKGIKLLSDGPDEEGVNWSSHIWIRCSGTAAVSCKSQAEYVIQRARELFNVK